MRTIILIALLSVGLCANGQVKVLSNGTVGTGSIIPSGYSASFYGRYFFIGSNSYNGYSNNMIKFDCGNSKPRIWSPSGAIVFFNNDVGEYQDIQVKTCYQYSDANAKTNINSLANGLATVNKLRGVSFNWKNEVATASIAKGKTAKVEYGLIAQEVEKVVPDLVITNDSTQGKMLSYSGIIPILIEAIKDLSLQVEDQKKQIDALKSNDANLKSIKSTNAQSTVAILSQNVPNPFNQTTEIGYYLPETTQKAVLYIYNMNGLQLKSIPIQNTGVGNVTINGSELQPGMYIYTLVADGQEIDTKRMILTQ